VLVGATALQPTGGEGFGFLAAAVHAEVSVETPRNSMDAHPALHRAIECALAQLP
jgi:hypothetical protein